VQGKHGRSNSARAHSNHSSLSLVNRRFAIKLPNLGIRLFASASWLKHWAGPTPVRLARLALKWAHSSRLP
jgi:hypothetical protein